MLISKRYKILSTLSLGVVLASMPGCRQRRATSSEAVALEVRAPTALAWPAAAAFPACDLADEATVDFVTYSRMILDHLAKANPETFQGSYEADKLCIVGAKSQTVVMASDAKSGRIVLSTGSLFMVEDQKDADLAVLLAHQMAYVTLQNGVREPTADELPDSVDVAELNRRFRLQAVFQDRKRQMFESIAFEARNDDMLPAYRWLVENMDEIASELEPLTAKREKDVLKVVLQDTQRLKAEFQAVLSVTDVRTPEILDQQARLAVQSGRVIQSLATKLRKVASMIARPLECDEETMPCESIVKIGRLAAYDKQRVETLFATVQLMKMPASDDPLSYEPYTAWMGAQAGQVAYRFYQNAGFPGDRFKSVFQKVFAGNSESSLGECRSELLQLRMSEHDTNNVSFGSSICVRSLPAIEALSSLVGEASGAQKRSSSVENLPETNGMLNSLRIKFAPLQAFLPKLF